MGLKTSHEGYYLLTFDRYSNRMVKVRPIEPEFDAVLDGYLEFTFKKRGGMALRMNNSTIAAKSLAAFMAAKPNAQLSLNDLRRADTQDVNRFLKGYNGSTANSYRAALNRLFRYLMEQGSLTNRG